MAPAGGIAEAIRKPASEVPADSILTDSRTEWGKMQTKQCTQCKETKDVDCFYRRRRNSNGLRAECKSCVSENNRAYRASNSDKIIQYRKKYWAANKELLSGKVNKNYAQPIENSEPAITSGGKICNRCGEWRTNNFYPQSSNRKGRPKSCNPCQIEIKEKASRYRPEYYQANKEKFRGYRKKYLDSNPGLNSFYVRRYEKRFKAARLTILPKEIRRLKSSPCFYCGSASSSVDHIIPLSKGGRHAVGNLVPACMPCNSAKQTKFLFEWKIARRRQQKPLLFDLVERIEK